MDAEPITIEPTDALIVVDVQNDFCPGGALAVPHGDEVAPVLNRVMDLFDVVVGSQDWHPANHCSFQAQGGPWPAHCVAGTAGADFHPGLRRDRMDIQLKKARLPDREAYSDFSEPQLQADLDRRGVRRVFIGGLATDYCVQATTMDALQAGFGAVVLVDAVRSVDVRPGDGDRALQKMQSAGALLARSEQLRRGTPG